MPVTFIARWFPRPERREEFIGILNRLASGFTPEIAAGVQSIELRMNRNGEFVAYEIWNSEEAMNALRSSQLFHDAIRDLSACCSRPLEFEHLDTLDGDGSIFKRYPAGKPDPKLYPDLGPMTPKWL